MSLIIKCLIDFNNNKYSLCIESDFNEITFNCVLNELQKQINQNISLKTHKFEVLFVHLIIICFIYYLIIYFSSHFRQRLRRIRFDNK